MIVEFGIIDFEENHHVHHKVGIILQRTPELKAHPFTLGKPELDLTQVAAKDDIVADLAITGHVYGDLSITEQVDEGLAVFGFDILQKMLKGFA